MKVTEKIAPKYFSIVAKPIDLSLIKVKINRGTYKLFSSFDGDIQLMFNNCFTYNAPSSVVHKMAVDMKSAWDTEKLSFVKRLYAPNGDPKADLVPNAESATSTKGESSLKPPADVKEVELPKTVWKPAYNPFALSTDIPAESGSLRLNWALCLFQEKQFLSLLTERFSDILNNILSRSIDSTEVFRFFDATNLRLVFQLINMVWMNSNGTLPVDENFFRAILPKLLAGLIEKANEEEFDISLHLKEFTKDHDLPLHQADFLEVVVSKLQSSLRKIALSRK